VVKFVVLVGDQNQLRVMCQRKAPLNFAKFTIASAGGQKTEQNFTASAGGIKGLDNINDVISSRCSADSWASSGLSFRSSANRNSK
jgi:hypothetical protein